MVGQAGTALMLAQEQELATVRKNCRSVEEKQEERQGVSENLHLNPNPDLNPDDVAKECGLCMDTKCINSKERNGQRGPACGCGENGEVQYDCSVRLRAKSL